MKHYLLPLFAFIAFGLQSFGQEGIPVYFDYLADNYYLVYPSMAGIGEGAKVRATARQQWFSVDEAPNMQTLNANFRLGDSNSGVGAIIFNDANGYHAQTGFKLTYAHHLKLGGDIRYLNQLSFGLSGTYLQSSLDETEFRSVIPDRAIIGSKISQGYFNVDLGLSYSKMEFYAHAAVLNILGSERNLYRFGRTDIAVPLIDNARKYLASVGYVFGKSEWQVEPSILFQMSEFNYQSESDISVARSNQKTLDVNAKVYKDVEFGIIWAGLSYRRGLEALPLSTDASFGDERLQMITPIVGANIGNFLVSYNYSYQVGNRFDNGGYHQITLGYDFGQTKRKYDCYCPAAQ